MAESREFYDNWEKEERELRYDMSKGFSQEDIEHIVKLEKEEWTEWKKNKNKLK